MEYEESFVMVRSRKKKIGIFLAILAISLCWLYPIYSDSKAIKSPTGVRAYSAAYRWATRVRSNQSTEESMKQLTGELKRGESRIMKVSQDDLFKVSSDVRAYEIGGLDGLDGRDLRICKNAYDSCLGIMWPYLSRESWLKKLKRGLSSVSTGDSIEDVNRKIGPPDFVVESPSALSPNEGLVLVYYDYEYYPMSLDWGGPRALLYFDGGGRLTLSRKW